MTESKREKRRIEAYLQASSMKAPQSIIDSVETAGGNYDRTRRAYMAAGAMYGNSIEGLARWAGERARPSKLVVRATTA
jgi:hypothetical protein